MTTAGVSWRPTTGLQEDCSPEMEIYFQPIFTRVEETQGNSRGLLEANHRPPGRLLPGE